jgi:hypothetical protein
MLITHRKRGNEHIAGLKKDVLVRIAHYANEDGKLDAKPSVLRRIRALDFLCLQNMSYENQSS